jgi:hypothetical protein
MEAGVKGSVFGLTAEESRAAQEREDMVEELQREKERATMSPAAVKLQQRRRDCEARLQGLRSIGDEAIKSLLSRTAHMEAGVTSLGIATKVRRLSRIAGGTMKEGDAPLMDEFDRANLRVLEELQRAQQSNGEEEMHSRPVGSAVGAVQARRGSNARRQSSSGRRDSSGRRASNDSSGRKASVSFTEESKARKKSVLLGRTEEGLAKKEAADKATSKVSKLADDDSKGVIPIKARLELARKVLRILREQHVVDAAPKYERAVAEYNNPTHVPVSVEQVKAFVKIEKNKGGGAEAKGSPKSLGALKRQNSIGTEHAELLQRRAQQQVTSTDIHTRFNNMAGGGSSKQKKRDQRGRAREFAEMMMNSDCKKPRWPEFNPFSMLNRTNNQLVSGPSFWNGLLR